MHEIDIKAREKAVKALDHHRAYSLNFTLESVTKVAIGAYHGALRISDPAVLDTLPLGSAVVDPLFGEVHIKSDDTTGLCGGAYWESLNGYWTSNEMIERVGSVRVIHFGRVPDDA